MNPQWEDVSDADIVPIDASLQGNGAQPAAQPAQPAAPQKTFWTKDQQAQLVDIIRSAKTPEEIVQRSTELGQANGGIHIPIDGPGGAKALIAMRDHTGKVPSTFAIPSFLQQSAKPDAPPDGYEDVSDAKVDYGTLSGLSPEEIKRKFDKLPFGSRPGMTDAAVHGMSAGLETELAGGLHAAGAALLHPVTTYETGGGNVADAYHSGRTDALAAIDYARLNHPYLEPAAEIGGAVLNPVGAEAKGVKGLAVAGAGYGGVSGFENSNGSLADRALNAGKDAGIGMVAAPALGTAIKAGAAVPNAVRAMVKDVPLSEVGEAARRQGLNLLPADAGGPITRVLSGITMQTPLGAPSIINAAQRLNDKAGEVVASHAASIGTPQEAEAAGQLASQGAQKYIKLSSRIGGRMYDAAAAKAGDATVDPVLARQTLDDQISRIEAIPPGTPGRDAQLSMLQAQRAGLNGSFPVQAIRDMRTHMFIDPDLRGGPAEKMTKDVIDAAAQDAVNSLRAAGRGDAADAFSAADKYWRDRLDTIDHVIEPIIGASASAGQYSGRSGEQVVRALNGAMKSGGASANNARAIAFVRSLPEEEQGVVRASLLNPLGKDKDGNFSLSRFSDDWRAIGDSAKSAFFSPETRAALNDLATVGKEAKASMKYASHSNTPRALIGERTVGSVATGASIGLGLATLGKTLAAQGAAGLLLSSPRFARWLARAPYSKIAPEAYIARLDRIAAVEPRIAGPIAQFRHSLLSAANDNVSSAAASGGNQQQDRQDH